jgi:sugar phosphate isomerase/epimerase
MFRNLSPSALGISGHESEIIELALTYGFTGMDLEVADVAARAKLQGMPYARRLIDSAKIRLGVFRLPFDPGADDQQFDKELEKLPEYARVAAELDCTRCVTTLPPADDKRPYHENFEFYRRRLAAVCSALRPAGVWFGVGFQAAEYLRKDRTFQFIHDLDALMLLVNMVDAPNIGLLLDVWNLVAAGGSVETIRSLPLGKILAVQVADLPTDVPLAAIDQNSRLLPGAENSQVHSVGALIALADLGYDGPVTPTPSRGIFHSRRRDVVVKQTGEALERVWRAAGLSSQGTLARRPIPAES